METKKALYIWEYCVPLWVVLVLFPTDVNLIRISKRQGPNKDKTLSFVVWHGLEKYILKIRHSLLTIVVCRAVWLWAFRRSSRWLVSGIPIVLTISHDCFFFRILQGQEFESWCQLVHEFWFWEKWSIFDVDDLPWEIDSVIYAENVVCSL